MTDAFPNRFFGASDDAGGERQRLGMVVAGSLNDGVEIKLDATTVIEGVNVGSYVTIDGQTGRKYFGLVTNIMLEATDRAIQHAPPEDPALHNILRGTAVFGKLQIKPHLVRERGDDPKPVKSVPAHFSLAYRSTPEEVREIFAKDEASTYRIGSSIDDDKVEINLNLERFVERSSAVFGRSGTGKTFLTLPLLANVIKNDLAACLIFDMHNDYGYTLKGDKNRKLRGLKQLPAIAGKVVIVTLDAQSSKARNSRPEFDFKIGYEQIDPEDIESVRKILALSDVQVNALHALKRKAPKDWIRELLSDDGEGGVAAAMIAEGKIAEGTYYAMQRKLSRLLSFEFLQERAGDNFVERVLNHLVKGESVVVEFGRYGDDLAAYVFVANFLTRRIRERYRQMKEAAEGGGGAEPHKLVIAIEEAHKFLEPDVAEQTIFGTIAREMRKYNVTLLIVDQRPSQIDAEVMSQIGTRVTCVLSDEKDISAVFMGVNGAGQLRSVLASLDSKQQALIMGHAVPMPVVVKTTEYGESSYVAFEAPARNIALRKDKNNLKSEDPFG
jgi:DNA helicase HerA-like ATPase